MSISELRASPYETFDQPALTHNTDSTPEAVKSSEITKGSDEPPTGRGLHRIRAVRREQGVSLRRIAQLMKMDIDDVRREEDETTNLTLQRLFAWQQVLEVPIADLLVDSNAPLSPPVLERARLVRLMKTAASILERAESPRIRRLAETLVAQLTEIMPELEGVTPWNSVGPRRTQSVSMRMVYRTHHGEIWHE